MPVGIILIGDMVGDTGEAGIILTIRLYLITQAIQPEQ